MTSSQVTESTGIVRFMVYALLYCHEHSMLVSFLVSILSHTLNALRTEIIFMMSLETKEFLTQRKYSLKSLEYIITNKTI